MRLKGVLTPRLVAEVILTALACHPQNIFVAGREKNSRLGPPSHCSDQLCPVAAGVNSSPLLLLSEFKPCCAHL